MAVKQFYATGSFKYGTRMLTAGDPVEMDAPTARLFMHLNKISDRAPSKPLPKDTGGLHEALTGESPTELTGLAAVLPAPIAKTTTKRAPRKRSTKKSK